MNLAIAGYGRMGHEIEAMAIERGHSISAIVDADSIGTVDWKAISGLDAVIEFTVPAAAPAVIASLLRAGIPVVSGTTGWLSRYEEMASLARECNTAFIHASNYSPGVFILSRLNQVLAGWMRKIGGYRASIEEIHHTAKLDAPSGTAIMLAEQIIDAGCGYSGWIQGGSDDPGEIPVNPVREGSVPGTHHVRWTSGMDAVTISHEAFGRKGFALGAVMAAEFIAGRKGVFTLVDLFGF